MADETFVPVPKAPINTGGVLSTENIPQTVPIPTQFHQGPSGSLLSFEPDKPKLNADEFISQLDSQIDQDIPKVKQDIAPWSKLQTYDADYTGMNYERYYNTPRVFKSLGFSPYRDNEQIYNNNMTWLDGWKRMIKQVLPLASVSFNEQLPWNALRGNTSTIVGAEKMNRVMSIGADTRNGFGAWTNNFLLNSGFTLGVLGEFAAEEAALVVVAAIPGLEGVSSLGMANSLRKTIHILGTFGRSIEEATKIKRSLNDVNKIRDIYKTFKATGLARVFTPHTLEATKDIYKDVYKGKALYTMANSSKVFGGFYRDLREVNAALAESKIEAGNVEYDMKNKLTDEYYNQHGTLPDEDANERIKAAAEGAAKETFLWNVPAIYLSNKVVFDKAIRGFVPARILRSEALQGVFGKAVFNKAWRAEGGEPWSIVNRSLKDDAKKLLKPRMWNPKNLTKDFVVSSFLYGKANLTEGLQELYQEAVAPAATQYYLNKYYHPTVAGTKSMWGNFFEQARKVSASKQGLDVFASGFLMGGLIQIPQKMIFEYIPEKFYAITNKEDYKQQLAFRKQSNDNLTEALNYIWKADIKRYFDPMDRNAAAQVNLDADANLANETDDKLGFYNTKDEMLFEHIHTLLQKNKIDLVLDHLNDLQQMTPQELSEAFGPIDTSEANPEGYYHRKIDGFKRAIEDIAKHYEEVEDTYHNPFDVTTINKDKDPVLWSLTYQNYQAFEGLKKLMVGAGYHHVRTIERMNDITKTFLSIPNFEKLNSLDLSLLFSVSANTKSPKIGSLISELGNLKREIDLYDSLDTKTPETAKNLARQKERFDILSEYYELLHARYLPIQKELKYAQLTGKTDEADEKAEILDGVLQRLNRVYRKYISHVAIHSGLDMSDISSTDINGRKILSKPIQDAFGQLVDFYVLHQDKADLVDSINLLHNPDIFTRHAEAFAKSINNEINAINAKAKELADKFFAYQDDNGVITQLSRIGVFFDPSLIEQFKKGDMTNVVFYYSTGNQYILVSELKDAKKTEVEAAIKKIVDDYMMLVAQQNKPAEPVVVPTVEAKPPAAARLEVLSTASPIAKLAPILPQLMAAYKAEEEKLEADGFNPLNIGWRDMSEEEILNSPNFRIFVTGIKGAEIVIKYNEDNNLMPKSRLGQRRLTIPQSHRDILKNELEWTDAQINAMDVSEAEYYISDRIKGTAETEEQRTIREDKERRQIIEQSMIDLFTSEYNAIDPSKEGAREALFKWISEVRNPARYEIYLKNGITSEVWEPMFLSKLAQLPKIESLTIGKIYKVDGVLYKVLKSQDEVYYLQRFDELGLPEDKLTEPLKIRKSDINNRNIISSDVEEVTPVTPDEAQKIDDNATNISDADKKDAQNNPTPEIGEGNFDPCE